MISLTVVISVNAASSGGILEISAKPRMQIRFSGRGIMVGKADSARL